MSARGNAAIITVLFVWPIMLIIATCVMLGKAIQWLLLQAEKRQAERQAHSGNLQSVYFKTLQQAESAERQVFYGLVTYAAEPDVSSAFSDPIAFEQLVRGLLEEDGWQATTTPTTGDQGADVVADKNGLRLIVQCKLYSDTVGNKAVQEVSAARRHYQADIAAVVTNSRYTPSARELARSNDICLLHFTEIAKLSAIARDMQDYRAFKAVRTNAVGTTRTTVQ